MQYSTNLLLRKPEGSDGSSMLTDLNYNWDILDAICTLLGIGGIWKERFVDVAAASVTAIHLAISGNGAVQNIITGITNPGDSRVATITTSNIASPSGNVVLTGLVRGVSTNETFVIVPGSTVIGNLPFDTITNIQLPAGVSASDTVSVGIGDKFGLQHMIDAANQVYKITVNAVDVTSTYASLVNAIYGTIDFSTAGVYQDMCVWYYQFA